MLQLIAKRYTTTLKESSPSKKDQQASSPRTKPLNSKRRLSDTTLAPASLTSEVTGVQELPHPLNSCMKRSRSHNERLNVKFSDADDAFNTNNLNVSSAQTHDVSTESSRTLEQSQLMSNSTVSLQSVQLNAEFEADLQQTEQKTVVASSEETTLTQRRKPPAKPLSEIDRYTMCSNRII